MPNKTTVNYICDKALREIADGKLSSIADIYGVAAKQLYAVIYCIVGNRADAQDVLQNSLMHILSHAKQYRWGSNAYAWLFAVVRNKALDYLRSLKPTEVLSDNVAASKTADCELLSEDVRQALSLLTEQQRQIVVMKVFAGLSHLEISKLLSLSYEAVRKDYFRARKKLASYYQKEFDL